eukprot:s2399_g4.t1
MWASLASRLLWLWLLWIPCSGVEDTASWRMESDEDVGIHKGLTDAAARGDTTAQSLLAQDYFYGANGVKKDVHTGVRWATVAAEAGDRQGLSRLQPDQ